MRSTQWAGFSSSDDLLDDRATREKALIADLVILVRPDVGHAQQVLGQSRVRETCIAGCVSTHTLGVMAGYSDAVARPITCSRQVATRRHRRCEGYLEGAARSAERRGDRFVVTR